MIGFGDDQEVTLTHVHNAGLLLSSTDKLQFGDSGTFIHQSSDGVLTIESDTTVDINGAVAFDGALTGITNITLSGTLSDSNYTFDTSGNVSGLGTVASGAITSSGIIKTDDTTAATSTTDGSLQTDGGLSVALDAVIGDDVFLLSDSAVFNMGAGSDFKITHDGTTGATLAGNPITITSAAAATWSTSAGVLTIDGDDGIVLQTTGSGDITSNDNVVLVDSAKLSLGTGSDSQIYYDGTDTFWDLSAAGTGDLMVASAGSFPSPDEGTAHFWWGSAGDIASKGDVGITIEAAGTVMLQFLSRDADSRSIYFGEASDSDAGAIAYNSAVSDGFHWRTAGANSMTLTGGATPTLDFLGAATISTSSGVLSLTPADDVDIIKTADEALLTMTRSGHASWEWHVRGTPLGTGMTAGALELRPENANKEFAILRAGTADVKFYVHTTTANTRIGGAADHGTTVGTNVFSIFDGTAPVGTLANGCSFFSTSGQMRVIQADGTASDVSPHNPETGEWWFNSKNTITGRVYRVHMERMMERLDEMLGGGFIEEFIEEV